MYNGLLLCLSSIIYFSNIDHLLASGPGDIFGVLLAQQSLHRCFDCVHGISGPGHSSGKIVDAGASANLPDVLLTAESEACHAVSFCSQRATGHHFDKDVPGGLAYNSSSVALTLALRSPNIVRFSYRSMGVMFRIARY